MAKAPMDFAAMTVEELDDIADKLAQAKAAKAVDYNNELIGQYQVLRDKMVAAGVVTDDQLPRLKKRGWTRSK